MPSKQTRIESMYAFIAVDPDDGFEGIPAFMGPDGMAMPLVGADMDRVDSLLPIAEDLAIRGQMKITLVHFTTRTEVMHINGQVEEESSGDVSDVPGDGEGS